jgi:tetratricopeptide (TPR) repeat protein
MREQFGQAGRGAGILVPVGGDAGLLTWRHLKDSINLLLLLAPVPLILILAHLGSPPGRKESAGLRADLLLVSVWLVLLMFLVDLKLGAVRDWDLYVPHVCVLALAGWYLASGGRSGRVLPKALLGGVIAVLLALAVPWLAVNLTADRALARLEAVAADMSPYALGLLHEQFAYHHQLAGNGEEVIRHYRRCGEVCPGHPRFHAIYGTHMLNEGHLDEAAAAYDRAVAADGTYVYGLKMGLLARVMNADYAGALEPARTLERMGQQDAEACAAHGLAAQQLGLSDEAERAYLRGYGLDPNRLDLLERAAGLRLVAGKYAQAEDAFRRVLDARPDHGQAALGLADALWQDYLANGKSRTSAVNEARLAETVSLIEKVLALGGVDPAQASSLRAWADQVGSSLAALSGD